MKNRILLHTVEEGSCCPECGWLSKLERCRICGAEEWFLPCGHSARTIRWLGGDLSKPTCSQCAFTRAASPIESVTGR